MHSIGKDIYIEDQYIGVVLAVINLSRGLIQIDAPPSPEDGRSWRAALLNLGSGVDRIYPPEHEGLAAEVAGLGAVLSEFPLGTPPLRPHFPRRNRLISGLSLGVVVVEASVESGALITADHALEQGREVFAVPGRVHARYSEGCNRLIKAGATLVSSWEDVLGELVPHLRRRERPGPTEPPLPELSPGERQVYELLGEGPLHIDVLIVRTALAGGRVASALSGLEMKGLVRQLPGKVFERARGG